MNAGSNRRILIVDDNGAIHDDFQKILCQSESRSATLESLEDDLFGPQTRVQAPSYQVDSAFQGQEALAKVIETKQQGRPYSVAFLDMRMPPGWDGVQTLERLWEVDPELQVVFCTAYSDYSWPEILAKFGATDRLLLLKKPFDTAEVAQLASALTQKWDLARTAGLNLAELKRMVAEQTKELQLTNERLQAADKARTEFIANMSHEIRTPMTAIQGYVELLLDRDVDEERRIDYAQTIQRNGQHLLSVINDILDISKIEAGRMKVERVPCSPSELLADVSRTMRARAREKGLAFSIEATTPIPETIHSDPLRIRQILLNLVGNAVKFTSAGSVRLRVDCASDERAQPRLRFEIEDTGPGIDPGQMDRLFQPFGQVDTSTTRRHGGTGLGLIISQRLARLLGGDIELASDRGHGVRVTTWIETGPLAGVRMIDGLQAGTPRPRPPAPDPGALLSGRVLLAEDGPDNQILLRTHLQRAGLTVKIVENGKLAVEAEAAARREGRPFDLVLMDMQMPVLDGYGATAQLRQAGFRGPILALTAHAMKGDRERCLSAGCDDYLTKPIERRELMRAVQRSLPRR